MREVTVDTSVFMESTGELLEKLMGEYTITIPLEVLDELDNLKDDRRNINKSQKAQKGIKFIESNYDKLRFGDTENTSAVNNDKKIIEFAKHRDTSILTFDIGMKVRARQQGIQILTELDGKNICEMETTYKGYKILKVDTLNDEDQVLLNQLYNNEDILGMVTNEYLIIRDEEDGRTIDIKRWTGTEFVDLVSYYETQIKPANDLQKCALDLLLNKDIAVKGIFGAAGCGKTYLATKIAVHMLKRSEVYDKILCVREVVGPGNDIGFIPGTKDDKISDFFKPIIQHLDNGKVEADDMRSKGKLDYEIPKFMKGLDIQDTYIYVDEAEDLCPSLIKLLGTRVGRGSCIVLTGDTSQAEHKYKDNSGVIELVKRSRGHKIFGYIVLDEDLRSDASKMFAEIF